MKEKKIEKKRIDKGRLFVQIIAGMMALLMIFGICMTFIFYLVKF